MVNLYQLFWSIDRYEAIIQTEMSMCFSIDKKHSEKKWNIVVKNYQAPNHSAPDKEEQLLI